MFLLPRFVFGGYSVESRFRLLEASLHSKHASVEVDVAPVECEQFATP